MTESEIVQDVVKSFRTFGQGSTPAHNNPIAMALGDREPMFAAGVSVADVVRFVMERSGAITAASETIAREAD